MLREAHSTTLASLPESFQSARAELLQLLQRGGILYRTNTQPVLSRDGASARWMLDSLAVTLAQRQLPDEENVRLWLALLGSKEEPCATLTERPRDRKGSI